MRTSRLLAPLLVAAAALTPSALFAQTFGGFPMTLSNNAACIDDANTCAVTGTNQVFLNGSGQLVLTNGQYATTGTAFTTAAQALTSSTPWTTRFDFGLQYAGFDPQADGFAFVLQSVGPLASGGGGGGIGLSGLSNSAAVGFRSWDNNDLFVATNGNFGTSTAHANWGTSRLVTGTVNLSYNGLGLIDISLTSNLADAYQATQAFDMSGLTPNNVYVGFVSGTGLSTQTAYIENWRFSANTNVVPEPASVALVAAGMVGIAGVAARRRRMS